MWLRLRFTLFGREIWALEIDEDGLESFVAIEDSEEEYEEEEEEPALKWGEPATFVRDIFVGESDQPV